MTENDNKYHELEKRIQSLRNEIKKLKKLPRNFYTILTILTFLGISFVTVISLIFQAERIAQQAKDEVVAVMVKANSAARALIKSLMLAAYNYKNI